MSQQHLHTLTHIHTSRHFLYESIETYIYIQKPVSINVLTDFAHCNYYMISLITQWGFGVLAIRNKHVLIFDV